MSGPLAQLVEQLTFNQLVTGSNPVRPTILLINYFFFSSCYFLFLSRWQFKIVYRLSSIVYRLSSIVYRLSSIVYRLSSIVYRLSSIVYRLSSIVYRLSSIVYRLSWVWCWCVRFGFFMGCLCAALYCLSARACGEICWW